MTDQNPTTAMLDLVEKAAKKVRRLAELTFKDEEGTISRRERAEMDTVRGELTELRKMMPGTVPGAWFQPGVRTNAPDATDRLKPTESMEDWLRSSGGGGDFRSPASRASALNDDDRSNLRLGAMVRGAVTGDWKGAEAEQRALLESSLADGGYLLAPELGARVIDRMRNAQKVMQLGATTVPMSTSEMYLGRLEGAANVAWKSEGQPIAESSPTFGRIVLTAKTLPILVKVSAELFEDISPDAMDVIEKEISSALALELDRVCLRGIGVDPEPEGILNQAGVTVTPLASAGASPNWDNILDAVATVRGANAEPNGLIWSSRTDQSFSKLKDDVHRYLAPPAGLDGIVRAVSNQVPNNLDTEDSSHHDASEIYVGEWEHLLVGLRPSGVNFRILNERYIDNLEYGMLMAIRADVALAHPNAFTVLTGVRP